MLLRFSWPSKNGKFVSSLKNIALSEITGFSYKKNIFSSSSHSFGLVTLVTISNTSKQEFPSFSEWVNCHLDIHIWNSEKSKRDKAIGNQSLSLSDTTREVTRMESRGQFSLTVPSATVVYHRPKKLGKPAKHVGMSRRHRANGNRKCLACDPT